MLLRNEIPIVLGEKSKVLLLPKKWKGEQIKVYIKYTHMHTHAHTMKGYTKIIFFKMLSLRKKRTCGGVNRERS